MVSSKKKPERETERGQGSGLGNETKKQKIISIVGPTATGKTKLALTMAKEMQDSHGYTGVDIISADSRQVYHGFEILSGADLGDFRMMGFGWQKKAQFTYPYLTKDKDLAEKIRLHGAAIIDLTEDWSLGQFHQLATEVIESAREDRRLVIVVGGTMLYHDHLLTKNDQITVPPNPELRAKADQMTVAELQTQLQKLDPTRFDQLNESDLMNSRRLVRHLEIALAQMENQAIAQVTQEAGSTAGKAAIIFLAALGGGPAVYDTEQKIYTTLVSTKSRESEGHNVRVRFARIIWNNMNEARIESIDEPEIYQDFFDKLSQSLFLTAMAI